MLSSPALLLLSLACGGAGAADGIPQIPWLVASQQQDYPLSAGSPLDAVDGDPETGWRDAGDIGPGDWRAGPLAGRGHVQGVIEDEEASGLQLDVVDEG